MLQTFAPQKNITFYDENHIILNILVILYLDDSEILSLCEQFSSQFPAWSSVVKHAFLKTSYEMPLNFIVTASSKVISISQVVFLLFFKKLSYKSLRMQS